MVAMGNSNTCFLRAIEWSCLVVAINSSKLEGTCTVVYLNEVLKISEIVADITLLLVFVRKTYVAVGVHL